ncbi:hypothetical protein KM043_016051 [Ampulex compressa]|nr:hypothetical protein KM043_016051 [Ampulex compressa]
MQDEKQKALAPRRVSNATGRLDLLRSNDLLLHGEGQRCWVGGKVGLSLRPTGSEVRAFSTSLIHCQPMREQRHEKAGPSVLLQRRAQLPVQTCAS